MEGRVEGEGTPGCRRSHPCSPLPCKRHPGSPTGWYVMGGWVVEGLVSGWYEGGWCLRRRQGEALRGLVSALFLCWAGGSASFSKRWMTIWRSLSLNRCPRTWFSRCCCKPAISRRELGLTCLETTSETCQPQLRLCVLGLSYGEGTQWNNNDNRGGKRAGTGVVKGRPRLF